MFFLGRGGADVVSLGGTVAVARPKRAMHLPVRVYPSEPDRKTTARAGERSGCVNPAALVSSRPARPSSLGDFAWECGSMMKAYYV